MAKTKAPREASDPEKCEQRQVVPPDAQQVPPADEQEQKSQQQPALGEAQNGEAQRRDLLHGDDRAAEQHRGDERGGVGGEPLEVHGGVGGPST